MAAKQQMLLVKVAAAHQTPKLLANICIARRLNKIAKRVAVQEFTERYLMDKQAADFGQALNDAWKGVQDWWANDENKAGVIGSGLSALGTYGLTGLVPGLRNNTGARLGLSGLAGVGGWYGGRYGANKLMEKYLNKGKEEGYGEGFGKGLTQGSDEVSQAHKEEIRAKNDAHAREIQGYVDEINKLNRQLEALQGSGADKTNLIAQYQERLRATQAELADAIAQQGQGANRDKQLTNALELLNSSDRYQQELQKQLGEAYDQQDALSAQLNAANNTITAEQARAYAAQQAADERIAAQQYELKRQLTENEMAGADTAALQQELAALYDNPQIAAILNPPKPAEPKPDMVAAGGANSGLHEQSAANAVKPEFRPGVKIDRLTDSYIEAMKPSLVDRLTQSRQTVQEKQLNAATEIIDMYNKARVSDPARAQQLAPYATQARELRRKLLGFK